jgi:hypothetical protein
MGGGGGEGAGGGAAGGDGLLRPLPWRVVHELDDTPYHVSAAAASYIDSVWEMPIIALTAVAPRTLSKCATLKRIAALRGRIADVRERTVRTAARADGLGGDWDGDGEGDGGAPPPALAALTQESKSAAAALAGCAAALRQCLGTGLAFMGEAPELLPLSLIVPAASNQGGNKIIGRLENAERALVELLAEVEEEVEARLNGDYAEEQEEGDAEAEAEAARRWAGRTPAKGLQGKAGAKLQTTTAAAAVATKAARTPSAGETPKARVAASPAAPVPAPASAAKATPGAGAGAGTPASAGKSRRAGW